jgi:hypothetical protein
VRPQSGLWLFLAVTFLNGTVLEIGRKIRAPEDERPRVDSYTRIWGVRAAPAIWLGVLGATAATAWLAARYTGVGLGTAALLLTFALIAVLPALGFLRTQSGAWARRIETASGLWILAIYLVLGTGPFLARWLER